MYLEINGCRTYCEELGSRARRTFLALHSPAGASDSRELESVFGNFSEKYRVIFFDLRGSGRSEEVGEPSFQQLSTDIEELRNQLHLGKIILSGGSGGGFLALEYTLRHPEGVAALILRGTGPIHVDLERVKKYVRSSGLRIDWDRFERYWTGHCLNETDMKEALSEMSPLYETPVKNANGIPVAKEPDIEPRYLHYRTHNFAMQEQMNGWNIVNRLGKIDVPALIVHGDEDWIVPLEYAELLRRGIPKSTLEIFEGCSHSPQIEMKDKFVALVYEFLANNGL
ncbi:MAG: alpha/beta hydrolase [Thaumarchaeota archaeon]|nr:alpha/beta hydrolase [Nitrososphaerota archaeon]